MEKLKFTSEDGEEMEYFILAETSVKGSQYLLVTEDEEGDTDALILKEEGVAEGSDDVVYATVFDEEELTPVMEAFGKLLGDVEFE
ncbi:MAG: DUF1292 domain-containing protein [Lachnospiraceae bacterium]|nr:DUF1292 domain-containing protein [Lachnospiraceae bacterium]